MGGFLLLLTIAVVVSFFAFREGVSSEKQPIDYNSVIFAKNRLMKDKAKSASKEEETPAPETSASAGEVHGELVYLSSKKYHKKECRFANTKSIPVSVETAKARGLKPCKICNS